MTVDLRAILEAGGDRVPASGLLRARIVAGFLGVSVRTLQHWRMAGTGPPSFRVGGQWAYEIATLSAWLEACQEKATKPTKLGIERDDVRPLRSAGNRS